MEFSRLSREELQLSRKQHLELINDVSRQIRVNKDAILRSLLACKDYGVEKAMTNLITLGGHQAIFLNALEVINLELGKKKGNITGVTN